MTDVIAWVLLALSALTVIVIAYEAAQAPSRRRASANGQVRPRLPGSLIPFTPIVVAAAVGVAVALLFTNVPPWLPPLVAGVVGVLTTTVTRRWEAAHLPDFVRIFEDALE